MRSEFCKNCGQGVLMIVQQGTGYCCALCQEAAEGKDG
jgi:hypothetical protein